MAGQAVRAVVRQSEPARSGLRSLLSWLPEEARREGKRVKSALRRRDLWVGWFHELSDGGSGFGKATPKPPDNPDMAECAAGDPPGYT